MGVNPCPSSVPDGPAPPRPRNLTVAGCHHQGLGATHRPTGLLPVSTSDKLHLSFFDENQSSGVPASSALFSRLFFGTDRGTCLPLPRSGGAWGLPDPAPGVTRAQRYPMFHFPTPDKKQTCSISWSQYQKTRMTRMTSMTSLRNNKLQDGVNVWFWKDINCRPCPPCSTRRLSRLTKAGMTNGHQAGGVKKKKCSFRQMR